MECLGRSSSFVDYLPGTCQTATSSTSTVGVEWFWSDATWCSTVCLGLGHYFIDHSVYCCSNVDWSSPHPRAFSCTDNDVVSTRFYHGLSCDSTDRARASRDRTLVPPRAAFCLRGEFEADSSAKKCSQKDCYFHGYDKLIIFESEFYDLNHSSLSILSTFEFFSFSKEYLLKKY